MATSVFFKKMISEISVVTAVHSDSEAFVQECVKNYD